MPEATDPSAPERTISLKRVLLLVAWAAIVVAAARHRESLRASAVLAAGALLLLTDLAFTALQLAYGARPEIVLWPAGRGRRAPPVVARACAMAGGTPIEVDLIGQTGRRRNLSFKRVGDRAVKGGLCSAPCLAWCLSRSISWSAALCACGTNTMGFA